MATARELLEQADALMRRNRARDTMSPAFGPRTMAPVLAPRIPKIDIPVLTEAMDRQVPPPTAMPRPTPTPAPLAPQPSAVPVLRPSPEGIAAPIQRAAPLAATTAHAPAAPVSRAFSTDVPVLTDAIEEIDAALIAVAAQGESSLWGDDARGEDSVLGPAPKSIAVIPPAGFVEAHAPVPNPQLAALAEEVRMQVLQRIDMFTDTGLREALGERLKPIVDRASADLVATINQHVGELLRTYVAEAIDRELDRLRIGG